MTLTNLHKEIDRLLQYCNTAQFPFICKMRKHPQGMAQLRKDITERITSGQSDTVTEAMYALESDFTREV
jgi:hypothetical protein